MSTTTATTSDEMKVEVTVTSPTPVGSSKSIYNGILSTSSPSKSLSSKNWVGIQERAFLRWINYKLKTKGYDQLPNIQELGKGLYLYHLIDSLIYPINFDKRKNQNASDKTINNENYNYITPPYLKPISKFQQLQNLDIFLIDLQYKQGLQIYNIGSEDILEGNTKLSLGLIWTIILFYTTIENNYNSDNSDYDDDDRVFRSKNKRDLLLHWCKKITKNYDDVIVKNFTSSWIDGLAFCAILDYFEPELIKFDELDSKDSIGNLKNAFNIAESIGICKLVDADEIQFCCDEKSLIAYISLWFDKFHNRGFKKNWKLSKKVDSKSLKIRLETFTNVVTDIIELKRNYLKNYEELNEYIKTIHNKLIINDHNKDNLEKLRMNLKEFRRFDKLKVNKLFNNLVLLKIKLNFSLNQYKLSKFPDTHLTNIESSLYEIKQLESQLNKKIHIKLDDHIKNFNLIANQIDTGLKLVSDQFLELCGIDEVGEQINEIKLSLSDLEAINSMISKLEKIKNEVIKFTESNRDTIEFKVFELKSKFEDLFNNCYGQLNFISEQFEKVDKLKRSLSKTRINTNSMKDEEEIKNFDFWGDTVDSMIGAHQFKLIFRKFDKGEKGYLNKLEFRDSMKFLFNDLKDDEINGFFEILYKSNNDILRGVKLNSFVELLTKFYDLDDNEDLISETSSNEDEDIKEDDLTDMLSKFHFNTFKLVSENDKVITIKDLKKIKVNDDTITKMGRFLEECTKEDLSFNYAEFFKDNEHSVLWNDDFTTFDDENKETMDLTNVLSDN